MVLSGWAGDFELGKTKGPLTGVWGRDVSRYRRPGSGAGESKTKKFPPVAGRFCTESMLAGIGKNKNCSACMKE